MPLQQLLLRYLRESLSFGSVSLADDIYFCAAVVRVIVDNSAVVDILLSMLGCVVADIGAVSVANISGCACESVEVLYDSCCTLGVDTVDEDVFARCCLLDASRQ